MKKILLFYLVFLYTLKIFSQGAVSGNGLFVASIVKENSKNYLLVHKFMTKQLVRKIPVSIAPDKLIYSYSGNYIALKKNQNYYIYDVLSEKKLTSIFSAKQIIFSKNDNFFLALSPSGIEKFDLNKGKLQIKYTYPGTKIYKLVLSPDDKTFAAVGQDKIFTYNINSQAFKETFYKATELRYNSDGKFLTVLFVYGSSAKATVFDTKDFSPVSSVTSAFVSKYSSSGTIIPERSSISKYGSFVTFYSSKNYKVDIYIFNVRNRQMIWHINNYANTLNSLFPQHWSDDYTLIAEGAKLLAGEYDLRNKIVKTLGLRIDGFSEAPELSIENQKKNLILSPDYHYAVLQTSSKLYVRDTRIKDKKTILNNVKFLSFTPDSKFMFVLKNNTVTAVVLSQLTQSLNNGQSVKLYAFDRTLSVVTKEQEITTDAKPPKGYAYFYVNNTKQIVKLDTAKLHITFKTINLDKDNVEIQVNLLDQHGNVFLGATDPSWKFIWCNVLLQDPNGTVHQVNDYTVEEVTQNIPTAYALVLDHSGSMGNFRANALQRGAWNLVQSKQYKDAFLLIKYDNNIRLLSPLTTNKNDLQSYLNNQGLKGFGGGTALVDATVFAMRFLSRSNYKKKVVMLFTDGYENASMLTKADLLKYARKHHIEINVIAFGKDINETYLKSIAYNTGGMYAHIYKTKDLKTIFNDVNMKQKHYYKIKFKTKVRGKHIAFIQLCQDRAKHDSLIVPFNNGEERKRIEDRNPVPPLKHTDINFTQFEKLKIPVNPPIKPVKSQKITGDFKNIHFPNIQFATNSDKIIKSEQAGINEIVKFMRKYPYVYLEIDGHTDNTGTHQFNMELSKKRAEAAKKLIVKAGIAPGRIITKGFGDTKPIASNATEAGKAKNRRIEFHIFVQK